MRTEAPGIRQSPLTKQCLPRTHTSPSRLSPPGGILSRNNPVYLRLLPMSARPQTKKAVLIPAPGSLALVTNTPHTYRPVRLSGRGTLSPSTVQKNPLNWSLFCGILFAWEWEEEGCRGKGAFSQGFQQQGLGRGLKLNRVVSDIGNGSQGIPPHKAEAKTAEKQHA